MQPPLSTGEATVDEAVLRAMAKWPNVPAVYGWLALDRRGNWLLKRETIGNAALNAFINRNYLRHESGAWFFQNGPQRVFVALDYTPFIYRLTNTLHDPLSIATHTGAAVTTLKSAWLDERGSVLIESEHGVGLIHDQDLDPLLLNAMVDAQGKVVDDEAFDALLEPIANLRAVPLSIRFGDAPVRLTPIRSTLVAQHFGFDAQPASPDT